MSTAMTQPKHRIAMAFARLTSGEVMLSVERTARRFPITAVAVGLLSILAAGCEEEFEPETICFVALDGNGGHTITCDDETQIPVSDGTVGAPGTTCETSDNEDGSLTITCSDGTTATIIDGLDGTGCSLFTEGDGTVRVTCEDGGTATVDPGQTCTVAEDEEANTVTITCEDGSEAVISNGDDAEPCEVTTTEAGISITCDDNTVTVDDGTDGGVCETTENPENGNVVITCDGGTVLEVGPPGGSIANLVGNAFLFGAADHRGVTITLEGSTEEPAVSGGDGAYSFSDVATGNYRATFEFPGYQTVVLDNIPAVPGTYRIPDVTLYPVEDIGSGDDAFIVDICPGTGGVLWLEDYELVETEGGSPTFGRPSSFVPTPGEAALNVTAVGELVYWDPDTDTETELGGGVWSEAVHCSPDGSLVAYLTNFDLFEEIFFDPVFVGDLRIWEVGGEVPAITRPIDSDGFAGRTSSCGLGWSPEGNSLAFLSHPEQDFCLSNGERTIGQLNLYTHGEPAELLTGFDALGRNVYCDLGLAGGGSDRNGLDPNPDEQDDPFWAFSADGGAVVYTAEGSFCETVGNLTLHRTSDNETWELWGNDGFEYSAPFEFARFSPAGDWLAFVALTGNVKGLFGELYLVDVDLSEPDFGSETEYCGEVAELLGVRGLHQRCVSPFTVGYSGRPWFEFSPDNAYLAYGDDFDLRVRDLAAGADLEHDVLGATIAFLDDWQVSFSPSSGLLLYNGYPASIASGVGAGSGSGCGSASLVLWSVADVDTAATLVDSRMYAYDLPAAFDETGDQLIYLAEDVFGSDMWYLPIEGDVPGEPAAIVDNVWEFCCGCGLDAVWSPAGESFAFFSSYVDDLGPAVWLYSLIGDVDQNPVPIVEGDAAFSMPIEYANEGGRVIAFDESFAGLESPLATGMLWEWMTDDLTGTILSLSSVFASYGEGNTVVFLEQTSSDFDSDIPHLRANLRHALDGDVALDDASVSLFNSFAMREDAFVYAVKESIFPDLLRNGAHRLVLE